MGKNTQTKGQPAEETAKTSDLKPGTVAQIADALPKTETPAAAPAAKPAAVAPLSILDAVKTLSVTVAVLPAASKGKTENDVARIEKELPAIAEMIAKTLKTDIATLDKCAAIAADILKKTDALNVPAVEGESNEPFYGTPAVVLFNVIHSVGHFAQRLDAMRRTLRDLDRVNKTAYLSKFERELSVYLALKMNVERKFLDSLPDRDLTVTRF